MVRIDASGLGINETSFTLTLNRGDQWVFTSEVEFSGAILGDVNQDGDVNLLSVDPFVQLLANGQYQLEADMDGVVDLVDVAPVCSSSKVRSDSSFECGFINSRRDRGQ